MKLKVAVFCFKTSNPTLNDLEKYHVSSMNLKKKLVFLDL